MKSIRIGTRGSALALAQTGRVRRALEEAAPGIASEVSVIRTRGDILSDVPLDAIGGKGVFVKDIERGLLEGSIDMAVHSLKDMQALLPEGLIIAAYLPREDPRDMIFSVQGHSLEDLPEGASVGTSSLRRRCQLRALRPDLIIRDVRGNVTTRLAKVGSGLDAVVLAAAGVRRLGLPPGVAMDAQTMLPSPGQGVIAVECRRDDAPLREILSVLDHGPTRVCAEAERAFLAALGQDCNLPAGALAVLDGETITISGMLGSPDGKTLARQTMHGASPDVGRLLARELMNRIHQGTTS
ncbi:MAG TPA: hydroxymethylbilane synthase [Deltaproteobacteria bacterium]|nr:hydroxymethylbilane synthase [Deltaproteobacteria bacterium]HQI80911.1 hydroxymethylbilane synthase [Deltaproteobacteria bacterium]